MVENEAMDKYYQGLEKKEMLEEKLSSVMELSITAYVCIKVSPYLLCTTYYMKKKLPHYSIILCTNRVHTLLVKFKCLNIIENNLQFLNSVGTCLKRPQSSAKKRIIS